MHPLSIFVYFRAVQLGTCFNVANNITTSCMCHFAPHYCSVQSKISNYSVSGNGIRSTVLQRSEFVKGLEEFGVEITLDTCVFHTPMISKDAKVIMTNSGKCSYYTPGELGADVAFGTMADCVRSAVAGRVCRKESPWNVC